MEETEAFRALGSADRQILLHELLRADGGVVETELARQIAARRHRLAPEAVSAEKIERAHLRLVHKHIPLLRELDVAESDDGEVTLTGERAREQLLEVASELEDWPPDDILQSPPP